MISLFLSLSLLLLQLTPSSALFYNPPVQLVNLGVEIRRIPGGWNLRTDSINTEVPLFSTIQFDSISLSIWPLNSVGVILVVIRTCGHSVWRKQTYFAYDIKTLIIPVSLPIHLQSPCNDIEIDINSQGSAGGFLFEVAGTAAIIPDLVEEVEGGE